MIHHTTKTHRRKGAVLIAVVGVLAVLSLMAAVFGMVMSMERTAGRNQRELEMARGAAQAAYEYIYQYLRSIPIATLRTTGAPAICPNPYNEFYSRELYRSQGLRIGFMTVEPSETPYYHADLLGKPWTIGLGAANAGMFDLNGHGHLADLGNQPDKNQRYTSFETSLTRLLKSRFDYLATQGANPGPDDDIFDFYLGGGNDFNHDPVRLRLARLLTTAIISYRYGQDGLPGTQAIEEHCPEHLPPTIFWPDHWITADSGAPLHGDYWGAVGADSGSNSYLENQTLTSGNVSTAGNYTLTVAGTPWEANEYAGQVVSIVSGTGAEQSRYILFNSANVLTIAPPWNPIPDNTSVYIIQAMNDPWHTAFWSGNRVALMLSPFNNSPTPLNKGVFQLISAPAGNGVYSLTTAAAWAAAPQKGDFFCINRAGANRIGSGDSIPTALLWPNGALSCERDIFPRAALTGIVTDIPADNQIQIDKTGFSLVGKVIRILDGAGRGQVRRIQSVAANADGDILTLADFSANPDDWRIIPNPVDQRYSGSILAYNPGDPSITVSGTPWTPGELVGLIVNVNGGEKRRIKANTANRIILVSPFSVAPLPSATFTIVSQTYAIEQDYFDSGTAATGTGTSLTVAGFPWTDDAFIGCVANIYDSTNPDAIGQTRLIVDNDANSLTLACNWRTSLGNDASEFRIEIPQDHKYHPDDLRGDDRVYRSVPQILPVMTDALLDDVRNLTPTQAGAVAGILYQSFSADLTVSGNSALDKTEHVSINDAANDGIDNDEDGLIDEDDEDWSAYPQKQADHLYDNLGLREWAGADAARILQAAQLVANIIDFRDENDVPTQLTQIGSAAIGTKTLSTRVFGYEGVHITEIMASPPKVYSTLTDLSAASELIDDGGLMGTDAPPPDVNGGDNDSDDDIMQTAGPGFGLRPDIDGWDWSDTPDGSGAPGYWQVKDPTNPANLIRGEWEFENLKEGWYAIRLRGNNGGVLQFQDLDLTAPWTAAVTVTTNRLEDPGTGAEYWAYVRDTNGRLPAVHVPATGKLHFQITAAQDTRFYGFQLLPQYIEITNCAAHDVPLNSITFNNILDVDHTLSLGRGAKLPGAAADGQYPIRYGAFVIAMSEDAFERQWGGAAADGIWGNSPTEGLPTFFLGDLTDDDADSMLINAANPKIILTSKGKTIASTGLAAGNPTDGDVGACAEYVSREKKDTPFTRSWDNFTDPATATQLSGSINKPDGHGGRTSLNYQYSTIWDTASPPNILSPLPTDAVWPLILNRAFPSPGWLGLVLTGNEDWRTIDPDPTLHDPPTTVSPPAKPEELLGTLIARALVGAVHARLNLNHPISDTRGHVLKSVLTDGDVTALETARPASGWINWDQLLNNVNVQDISNRPALEDSGAATFADDYADDPDEHEEWARRYSNVVDLSTSNFKYIVAGLAYRDNANPGDPPVAVVRIEVDFAIDGPRLKVVNFRYVTD